MIGSRLDRLRRMSLREGRWRVHDALHIVAERAAVTAGARWNRRDLARVLSESARDACGADIDRKHWRDVQNALESRIQGRPARFVLDSWSAPAIRDQVIAHWPDAPRHAAARADRLLDGVFDLLGFQGVQCAADGRIDWHADPVHLRRAPQVFYADVPFLSPEVGDHKVIWELNRHQHFLALGRAAWLTGDPRYTNAIRSQLIDWLVNNPPYVGINWASMLEIGFRAISWTWALHCLLGSHDRQSGDSPWLVDMLVALDRQLTHVERHLSYYFSPNTHLTGEALALYVVGTAVPELASSARWAGTGRRILLEEIDRQILGDGGHVERSTHYQRYTLDFYLLATLTARLAGDAEAACRFAEAARRTAEFTRTMADARGRLPLLGDDDGGMLWPITGRECCDVRDSLALAAAVLESPGLAAWGPAEEAVWIAGSNAPAAEAQMPAPGSRLFDNTGYFVARTFDGSHAVLDVGPHGYRNGGHAHSDALSLTLSMEGRPLLIDPGTSTYTMDAGLRNLMRSTASHNTLTIDDRSQSLPAGPFHWHSTVDARTIAWRSSPAFDWIEAVHDGYFPARHRRTVVRTRHAGWLIVDTVRGPGRHVAAAHWHFDRAWRVMAENGRVRATHDDGRAVWMLSCGGELTLHRGDRERGFGWCAPVYGQLEPTTMARLATDGDLPILFATWIDSARAHASPRLRTTRISDTFGCEAIVVELLDDARRHVFLIRESARAGHMCRVGDFETDAAMLHYVEEDGRLAALSIAGGRHCLTTREHWLSLAADEAIHDLQVTARGDGLAFESTDPPTCLTVYGSVGDGTARANGRDLPLSSKPTAGILLINDSDWPPSSTRTAADSPVRHGAAFARH